MTVMVETLVCSRCDEEKELEEFPIRRSAASGRYHQCKACGREIYHETKDPAKQAQYREQNRELCRTRVRASKSKDPEATREINRRSYNKDIDRSRARGRVNAKAHYDATYRVDLTKTQIIRERNAEWKRNNRELVNKINRARFHRTKRGEDEVALYYRESVLRFDPCSYCGSTEAEWCVDHIHPVSEGGSGSWFNLTRACMTCNLVKGTKSLLHFLLTPGKVVNT